MTSSRFSAHQLEQLKKQAKKLAKEKGLSHSLALDQLAKRQGFGNWSQLAKGAPDAPASKRAMQKWFLANHTAAVNISPYDGAEGGYIYPTIEIEDVLMAKFPDADHVVLEELISELETDGPFVDPVFLKALYDDRRNDTLGSSNSGWSPPFKKGRYKSAEIIEVNIADRTVKVACVRYCHGLLTDKIPGQLIFRCPVCNKIHYHGGSIPVFGGGDGCRVPHCHDIEKDFQFDLVEVSDASRAGHLPKTHLKHTNVPPLG